MNFSQYIIPELEYGSVVYSHKDNICEFYTNVAEAAKRAVELLFLGKNVKVDQIRGNRIDSLTEGFFKKHNDFKHRLLNAFYADHELFFIEQNTKNKLTYINNAIVEEKNIYDVEIYSDHQTRGFNIYDLSGQFVEYTRAKLKKTEKNNNWDFNLIFRGFSIKLNYKDFEYAYTSW